MIYDFHLMTLGSSPNRTPFSLKGVQDFAARNLKLLLSIETTVDALNSDSDLLTVIARDFREVHQSLEGTQEPLDPSGSITSRLEQASDACVRIFQIAIKRHESARRDPGLQAEDGVTDAYESFLNAIRDTHDSIEALREWIAVHDAVLEPTTGEIYSTPADLFKALLPKR